MNKYQLLFIIKNDVEDTLKEATVEKFTALIAELSGTVTTVDKWGTKKYAYPINFKTEGYYVHVKFELAASGVAELERQMRLNEHIVRHLVTREV